MAVLAWRLFVVARVGSPCKENGRHIVSRVPLCAAKPHRLPVFVYGNDVS